MSSRSSDAANVESLARFLHMCQCEPWAQRWKADEPERCCNCNGMFPTHTVAARRLRPGDPGYEAERDA